MFVVLFRKSVYIILNALFMSRKQQSEALHLIHLVTHFNLLICSESRAIFYGNLKFTGISITIFLSKKFILKVCRYLFTTCSGNWKTHHTCKIK